MRLSSILTLFLIFLPVLRAQESAPPPADPKTIVMEAIRSGEGEKQVGLVMSLLGTPGNEATRLLALWREGAIYLHESGGETIPVLLDDTAPGTKKPARRLLDDSPVLDDAGKPVLINPMFDEVAETDSKVRAAMKQVADLAGLSNPDPKLRLRAITEIGFQQDPEKAPVLAKMLESEKDGTMRRALEEARWFSLLKHPERDQRMAAVHGMGDLASIASRDALRTLGREAIEHGDKEMAAAVDASLKKIASHLKMVDTAGTAFRGLSQGSILLVVSIGLAITFGLMGVINMAHGELIVVGAYTAYIVQNIFEAGLKLSPFGMSIAIPGLGLEGAAADRYFLVALPLSFLAAAAVGLILERTVIRWLYSRPLESLLATWGVSLVMQQLFRLIFGSNNVQVSSPAWLSGNWTFNDILFGWNRVFVIAFAIAIVIATWLTLTRTPLGLLIRAVMQNRAMAACMGVRTERVNMLTFAFGSGLAGLAGCFLSQLGNVGPNLGQSYIVDSFMTVVVGGVGSLFGTVISALGIGIVDQSLQQILGNPVLGKILVLVGIILFLQWKPSGLFVTRSRSLDHG